MKVAIQFKCPSCDKAFVSEDSFATPYYTCDNCTEYWPKEDGRNCPQCHKFGRNPEMPVCEDCTQEVEEHIDAVNPDEVDVVNEDGDEIVSEKKATMRKTNQQKNEEARAKATEIRDRQTEMLQSACQEYGITEKNRFGDFTLSSKTVLILGQEVTLRVTAHVDYDIYCTEPPPFRLEFRLKVDAHNGGWDGYLIDSERFKDIHKMFDRAKDAMNNPIVIL